MAKHLVKFTRRSLIRALPRAAAVVALAVALPLLGAKAHKTASGDLVISHPWAQPAWQGGKTRMYAVIENEEQFKVSLTGVSTPAAQAVELKFRSHHGRAERLSSRVIDAEETLNLASSQMWFELSGLKADLKPGETFPATFEFADRGPVRVDVIVGDHTEPIHPSE